MKSARGFAPIVIIIVVLISIGFAASGYYYFKTKGGNPKTNSTQSATPSPSPTSPTNQTSGSVSNLETNATKTQLGSKTDQPQASPAQTNIAPKTFNSGDFSVTVSCRGYAPKVFFNWKDEQDETGYYLDINDEAWTGPSSPSGWVFVKLGANSTTYTWDTSRNLEGADNPVPQNSKNYWWRLRVFNDSTATYQNRDIYPGSSNPPGDSFLTPNCVPNASSYSLTASPQQSITFGVGQSYGVNALLKDNSGNVVLYQDDFSYTWSQESSKIKIATSNTCTFEIQPPCPNAHANFIGQYTGLDKVTITVKKKSTGQEVASTTFNVTVN